MSGTAEDGQGAAAVPAADPAASASPTVDPGAAATGAAGGAGTEADVGNVLADGLTADPAAPAADPAKAAEPPQLTPENYKLTVPDGIDAKDPMLTGFLASAANLNLPEATVQAILAEVGPEIAKQMAAPYKAWQRTQAEWQSEMRADPVIGGEKLPGVIAQINRAITSLGDKDLAAAATDALRVTGVGNNPAMVKLLARLTASFAEGGPVTGGQGSGSKNVLAAMYPSSAEGIAARGTAGV
jgi:hypothetical protein